MKRSGKAPLVRLGLVVGLAASLFAGAAPASVQAATPAASGLGKEVRLTTNPAEQMWPEVSGRKVAYSDYRHDREVGDPNDPEILYDIRVLDVKTGKDRLLTPKHTARGDAAISGNRVVWVDDGNGRTTGGIWYHNLATGTHKRVPVKGGQEVAISGTRLCYERSNRIYTYDLATKKEKAVSPKHGSAGACDISGKVVVWQDFRNGNFDIYAYDLGTKKERRLTTDPNSQGLPKISGKVVVFDDDRNGALNSDIYAYDLGTKKERPVATAPGTQWFPNISGHRVVWMDERHGADNTEVYAYDLRTGTETRVTEADGWSGHPTVSGSRIVYEDNRAGQVDLYLRTLV